MNPVTIFSLVPQAIRLRTNSFNPGFYEIEKSDGWVPSSLVIKPGHFFVQTTVGSSYAVPVDPKKIAEGLVSDWHSGSYFPHSHEAGLWIMAGEVSADDIPQSMYEQRFAENVEWMKDCIRHADDEYLKRNESPNAVTPLARACARALDLDRAWLSAGNVSTPSLKELLKKKDKKNGTSSNKGGGRSRPRKSADQRPDTDTLHERAASTVPEDVSQEDVE